jgi:hypothetical protein
MNDPEGVDKIVRFYGDEAAKFFGIAQVEADAVG